MTVTHLLFALMITAYILIAIQLEESDLVAALPEYADYRKRVPMLVPGTLRREKRPRGNEDVKTVAQRSAG